MTLDEAIRHAEEVAEGLEKKANTYGIKQAYIPKSREPVDCISCAAEHRQLAEWLRELVAYKKIRMCGNCRHYVRGTTHFGECHVTSDIEPCVVGVNQAACGTFFDYKDFDYKAFRNKVRTE